MVVVPPDARADPRDVGPVDVERDRGPVADVSHTMDVTRWREPADVALSVRLSLQPRRGILGVAASRFGARVALDLLGGRETEATRLRYVRSRPVPFPPEPIRSGVIQLTRKRLAAADRNRGRRGLWLRTLDGLGLGFDS
jgi:hypothetical protein